MSTLEKAMDRLGGVVVTGVEFGTVESVNGEGTVTVKLTKTVWDTNESCSCGPVFMSVVPGNSPVFTKYCSCGTIFEYVDSTKIKDLLER